MKKALLGGLVLTAMVLVLIPVATRLDLDATAAIETPATPLAATTQPLASAASIVCDFECADGYGFTLDPCNDGSLGACCTNGPVACADHGGMVDGICFKGRLGLPCQPIF